MKTNTEKYQDMLDQFIELANQFKDDGNELQVISAALMSASSVYTTYVHAGNDGFLQESGITKVINAYEKDLRQIQAFKAAQAQSEKTE